MIAVTRLELIIHIQFRGIELMKGMGMIEPLGYPQKRQATLWGSLVLVFCGTINLHAQVQPPGVFVQPQVPYSQSQMVPPPPPPAQLIGPPGVFVDQPGVYAVQDYSWLYVASPQPRQIKEQDLITILVKEISEVSVNSRFNRQRRGNFLAELKEFIRLDNNGNLTNAAASQPTMDGNLSSRITSTGIANDREEVIYRIAATVVDVLPNGNLVLEAKKTIQTNKEMWTYSLTGTIRSQDIYRDNTALSENIANLQIKKTQTGKVYDSTKRAWGTRLFDMFFPF